MRRNSRFMRDGILSPVSRYNTVIVWCETFSMFITAAKYR
jgi:hypothetical protein